MALKPLYKGRRTPTNDELAAQAQSLVDYLGLPGHATVGDVAKTLTWGQSKNTQVWNTALTADRVATLATAGVPEGARFRVVRAASATGSFNLNIGTGPLKALGTAGTWAEVGYNGTAWVLVAAGSL